MLDYLGEILLFFLQISFKSPESVVDLKHRNNISFFARRIVARRLVGALDAPLPQLKIIVFTPLFLLINSEII